MISTVLMVLYWIVVRDEPPADAAVEEKEVETEEEEERAGLLGGESENTGTFLGQDICHPNPAIDP